MLPPKLLPVLYRPSTLQNQGVVASNRIRCLGLSLPSKVPTDIRLVLCSAGGLSRLWLPRSSDWSWGTSPTAIKDTEMRREKKAEGESIT